MDKLAGELRSMAAAMDGTAAIVGVSGTLVLMLRDQVRDWIASFVADLIEHALVAVATAAITLGGSVAVFIGTTVLSEAMHKIAEGMERSSTTPSKAITYRDGVLNGPHCKNHPDGSRSRRARTATASR
jgi:hypothetical protein